jgi:hypothetical protein
MAQRILITASLPECGLCKGHTHLCGGDLGGRKARL